MMYAHAPSSLNPPPMPCNAQVVKGCAHLGLTPTEAAAMFDQIDVNGDGLLRPPTPRQTAWVDTLAGRITAVSLKLVVTVFVGAAVLMLLGGLGEGSNTWVDAVYFSTVTATSIGYGDVVPTTHAARVFLTVYMPVATVVVGSALGEVIDVYVNDVVGEGIFQILLESTTWVHKIDVAGRGYVTEADYVLFKLQQVVGFC